MSFDKALAFVLAREGAYSNDPTDRGGATQCGVTQVTYDTYRRSCALLLQGVERITENEISAVYFLCYWLPSHCHELPPPLDIVQFDSAVQHGPKRAILFLQRVLGVAQDGEVGPRTVAAVGKFSMPALIDAYLLERGRYYRAIVANDQSQQRFSRGWANRLVLLRKATTGLPPEEKA